MRDRVGIDPPSPWELLQPSVGLYSTFSEAAPDIFVTDVYYPISRRYYYKRRIYHEDS